jgi:hypothetical protein
MAITDYGGKAFTGQMFGITTLPATFYLGLSTSRIESYADGTLFANFEPSASLGYARQALTRSSAKWVQADGGFVVNYEDIVFGPSTGEWGLIQTYGLLDAATAGNLYVTNEFVAPRRLLGGQYYVIERGALTYSIASYVEPVIV